MNQIIEAPVPRLGVMAIDPYVPGKSSALGVAVIHKLSSNETPLGPSPKAVAAFSASADKLALYPDGTAMRLREAIGRRYGLNPENIICGAGSDEVLSMVSNAYLAPGDEAIYSAHGFLVYKIAILGAGATPIVAPEQDFTAQVDAMLARVSDKTKMVYLANPNNPTGTYLPLSEVKRLHAGLPKTTLLVLDAAYAEYVQRNDYEAGIELVSSSQNVLMTRTFSKIHGLAAVRLGWGYGPTHMIDAMNRIRGPFNVSSAAIAAGIAAIEDQAFMGEAVRHNTQWLAWLTDQISALKIGVTPSVCNFLLLHFPQTGKTAETADAFLTQRGLILRRVSNYGLPDCLRLTVGTAEQNHLVVAALKDFMAA